MWERGDKSVRNAVREDINHLAETLSAAFDSDPVMSWCIRQDEKRQQALRLCFNYILRDSFRYSEVTCTTDLDGCAIWVPPNRSIGASTISEMIRSLPDFIHWMGLGRINRWITLQRMEDKYRPQTPHFYLAFLAVSPSKQGKGYGTALLEYQIARLDAERLPAYLESSNIRNNPLYERYEFKVIKEMKLPNGPTEWCMWREPRKAIYLP